jgi:hypothetical protein
MKIGEKNVGMIDHVSRIILGIILLYLVRSKYGCIAVVVSRCSYRTDLACYRDYRDLPDL